jgi:hypothetical protein
MRLGPYPNAVYTITVVYQAGVPELSNSARSNWLLAGHPDAYLFGTLVEAEAFIGHDERAAGWLQRREAAFGSIEQSDRKGRWSAGPLQIVVDGITSPAGGGGGSAPTSSPVPPDGGGVDDSGEAPVRIVNPPDGGTVIMLTGERAIYIDVGPRGVLTIRLPPLPTEDMTVDITFERPVGALSIQDSDGSAISDGGPTSAYGPGAGLQFRFVGGSWVYWK